MTGLMIFLGLLGTFWGLLLTVSSVGDVINSMSVGSGDINALFEQLKSGLARPLKGMGTAFSSSMLGLAGALVLGFLDLTAGQAQNRFFNELEEWLAGITRLASGVLGDEGEGSVPVYVQALLEQTAENMENLQRILARGEDGRNQANQAVVGLTERIATLSDTMRTSQQLMLRIAEGQQAIVPALARVAEQRAPDGGHEDIMRAHLRNIELYPATPAHRIRARPRPEHRGAAQRHPRPDPHHRRPGRGPAAMTTGVQGLRPWRVQGRALVPRAKPRQPGTYMAYRDERQLNAWPGYVDALSTLLMVIIFVLLVFVLAQAFLSVALSGRDQALDRLNRQMAELSDMLALERGRTAELRLSLAQVNRDLQTAGAARDDLAQQLAALQGERDKLTADRDALKTERDRLSARLADAALQTQAAQARAEELTGKLAEAEKRGEALTQEAAAAAAPLAEARRQLAEASRQSDATAQEQARLAEQVRTLTALRDDLEKQAHDAAANAATEAQAARRGDRAGGRGKAAGRFGARADGAAEPAARRIAGAAGGAAEGA